MYTYSASYVNIITKTMKKPDVDFAQIECYTLDDRYSRGCYSTFRMPAGERLIKNGIGVMYSMLHDDKLQEALSADMAIGWSSLVNLRHNFHLPMLDIDLALGGSHSEIFAELHNRLFPILPHGHAALREENWHILCSSPRHYHAVYSVSTYWDFYTQWLKACSGLCDPRFVACSLRNGHGTLRISSCGRKPSVPHLLSMQGCREEWDTDFLDVLNADYYTGERS